MTDARFGKRFKEYREKLNWTQQDLADKAKVPVTFISSLEQGKKYPRFEKMVLLLNTLGISADAVFCDMEDAAVSARSSDISQKLDGLPIEEKNFILDVLDMMIAHSYSQTEDVEQKQIDNPPET